MSLTVNFTLSEFASKDGTKASKTVLANLIKLATNLEELRAYLDKPITITSGYRSVAHNELVGGEPNSFHTKGMAADIKVAGLTPKEVAKAIEHLISIGRMKEGGIGKYGTFTHYDIRNTKARWSK